MVQKSTEASLHPTKKRSVLASHSSIYLHFDFERLHLGTSPVVDQYGGKKTCKR